MTRWMVSLAFLALAAAPVAAQEAPRPAPLASAAQSAVVLRFSGREVTRDEYEGWLVATRGEVFARQFVERYVFEREAKRLGVAGVQAAARAEALAEIEERVQKALHGDRGKWIEELELAYRTPAGRIAERSAELEKDYLLRNVAAVGRVVPPEKIEREWTRLYGRNGRRFEVRLIYKRLIGPAASGAPREERERERARLRHELELTMRRLRERALAGEPFAALARDHSDDARTRANGGAPEGGLLNPAGWPDDVLDQLAELQPGEVSEPLFLLGGFWLVKLEELHVTPLESVEDELRKSLLERGPETDELAAAAERLLADVEWEVLPAMLAQPGNAAASPEPTVERSDDRVQRPDDGVERADHSVQRPDDPVLRIDGADVARADFARWLVQTQGEAMARRFAEERMLFDLAREAGVAVSDEEVARRVDEEIEHAVRTFYDGDRARWEREVAKAVPLDAWKRDAAQRARVELVAGALASRVRVVSDEMVRAAWEQRYGPLGVSLHLRMIRIDPEPPAVPDGATPDEAKRLVDQAIEAARAKARDVAQRAADGEDFATLARTFSSDDATRADGGEVPRGFDHRTLPPVLQDAIRELVPGEATPAIEVGPLTFVFELLGREEVPLADVEAVLRAELKDQAASPVEIAGYRNVLMRDVKVEILPALFE